MSSISVETSFTNPVSVSSTFALREGSGRSSAVINNGNNYMLRQYRAESPREETYAR